MHTYLLVSDEAPRVEQYMRKTAADWDYHVTDGLDAEVELRVWRIKAPMRQIYLGVKFPPARLRET